MKAKRILLFDIQSNDRNNSDIMDNQMKRSRRTLRRVLLSLSILVVGILMDPVISKHIIHERKMAINKYKMSMLTFLAPDFSDLKNSITKPQKEFPHRYIRGNPKGYLNYYEKLLEFYPDLKDSYAILGFLYYHLKEYNQAILNYGEAIKANPMLFWSYYNLGVLFFEKGQFDLSAQYLQKAVSLDPNESIKILRTTGVYYQIWQQDVDIQEVVLNNLKSGYQSSFILLALNYNQMGKFQEMLNITNIAIRSNFDSMESFYYMGGFASYKLESYEQAIDMFTNYVELNPDSDGAHYYLDLSIRQIGKREKDTSVLRKRTDYSQNFDILNIVKLDEIFVRIF